MRDAARFWDGLAVKYSKQPVPDEAVYGRKLELTQSYLRPGMQVLELGCGTGTTALAHAPFVKHIRAVDFSSEMIAIARDKARAQGVDNIEFEVAAFDAVDVAEASVDAVLALSLLHLLPDLDAAVAAIHRMLKPGGLFFSSTACIADIMYPLKFVAPIGRFLGLLPLLNVFSKDDLVRSIEDGGFSIEHCWQPENTKSKGVFIVAEKRA